MISTYEPSLNLTSATHFLAGLAFWVVDPQFEHLRELEPPGVVGGQEAEGKEGKVSLSAGEVDLEESVDEADLADLNPECAAV